MLSNEEILAMEILKACGIKCKGIDIYKILLNLINRYSKEIEELKENKGYHLGFIDGGTAKKYEYQDKIKAKIEEVKEEKEHYLEINDEYNAQICECIIEEYESLLEKEE